jgi:hypothetical protein
MPLTIAECQVAIDQAKKYPSNSGTYFIVPNATEEELLATFSIMRLTDDLFRDPRNAALWLKLHPEDVEKG